MTTATEKETLGFQTEARQLLKLMIHSLYSNREIFLRELISNAADAADKLRFEALADDSLYEGDPDLSVRVDFDADAKTITVADNGIGMNRDEVVAHLGTIAKSGTAEFLQKLTGDQKKDSHLIGQFGVGFYSAFIVADRVEVFTRRAGTPAADGVHWESTGESDFSVETVERAERGTTIVLHLKDDAVEFADAWRLRGIIKKYSDHISIPVRMRKTQKEEGEESPGDEVVNSATALWTLPRSDISDDEYKSFYQHVAHDFAEPLTWSHNKVEGTLEYTSLLYIPSQPPFDLYQRDAARGLKLYVQRIFIMDDAEQFLPLYLRFVRGVVDSNDLSLNVSREILQRDPKVDSMKSALTKRILDMLAKLASDDPEKYATFWAAFGSVLKEGPAEDYANRERIAKLFRFASTNTDTPEHKHSLEDYVGRMREGQEKIYYIAADNFTTAKNSPHLEVFRKKGIEVLLLSDRIDEWMIGHLGEFDGKPFADVARASLDLGKLEDEQEQKELEKQASEHKDLLERVKAALSERVEEVRATDRLTDSPACLAVADNDIGLQMRRILEAAGQDVPESKPIFELNCEHPLVQRLEGEGDESRFNDLASILFDQAQLASGGQLDDPAAYVHRLNALLLEVTT